MATNFLPALQRLSAEAPVDIELIPGASGVLFAQIRQGAPFDIFLSADEARPAKLAADGLALESSLRRYCRGRLVLWQPAAGVTQAGPDSLSRPAVRLAIANPAIAPYGNAAMQLLNRLAPAPRPQLVTGNSVGQAFHFALSGHADMALVAYAQVLALPANQRGSLWQVPATYYSPLFQAAVIPRQSRHPQAAELFLEWLTDSRTQAQLIALGYLPLTGEAP